MGGKTSLSDIQVFFVALTPFVKILTLFFTNRGIGDVASQLGSLVIYVTILISLLILVENKRFSSYLRYAIRILLVFIVLYLFQRILTSQTTLVNSHISNFVLVGIGAFTIGYSLSDINQYIKRIGIISIVIGLIFLFEPITGALLAEDNMVTGYTLAPICIYGLLYSLYTTNTLIKILAILPCITVTLFTSRGCGLSIISFYLLGLIWKNRMSFKKALVLIGVFSLVAWGVFSLALNWVGDVADGSMLGKYLSGELTSDNGREYLLELGWLLVLQNPLTGLGIDGDIAILNRYIENYPFIHNVIVELFLDFGIPIGLVLLLLYFMPIIRSIKRAKNTTLSLLLIAMLCGVWIRLFFSDSYSNNLFNIMLLLGLALSNRHSSSLCKNNI